MNWPNDADGDVLRNLEKDGFNFHLAHTIDFNVDISEWPPPEKLTSKLSAEYGQLEFYPPEEGDPGYILFGSCDIV